MANNAETRVIELTHWLDLYRKPILIGVGVLVVAVVGLIGWTVYRDKSNQGALQSFYEIEKLEQKFTGAKEGESKPKDLDPVRREELIEAYRKAILRYGSSEKGAFLHYQLAKLLREKKDYQAALGEYREFLQTFSADSPYRGLLLLAMADCAANLKDIHQAKGYLLEVKLPVNPQKEFILFALGKVEQELGEADQAQKHFDALLSEYKDSPLADRVRELKVALRQGSFTPDPHAQSMK